MEKILLGKNKKKRGVAENNSVTLQLVNNERLLPHQEVINDVDQYETYNIEKDKCDRYRLFITLNPICSNVLFNHLTEVVYKHSDEDIIIDENGISRSDYINTLKCIEPCSFNKIDRIQVIKDTEYSHPLLGNLEYRPGIDIFNNHLLRKNDFVVVNKRNDKHTGELLERQTINIPMGWEYNGSGIVEKKINNNQQNYFKLGTFKLTENFTPQSTKDFIFNSNEKEIRFTFPGITKIEISKGGNPYEIYDTYNSNLRYLVDIYHSTENENLGKTVYVRNIYGDDYKMANEIAFKEKKEISIEDESWYDKPIYMSIYCSLQINISQFVNNTKMKITFDKSNFRFKNLKNSTSEFIIKKENDTFNTINDYLRNSNGDNVKEYNFNIKNIGINNGEIVKPEKQEVKLYQMNEILTFEEAINKNLIEKDGWFGFINPQTMDVINYKDLSINKCINNRNSCDFIDMYPDRTLYSFRPKINEYKNNRREENWKCLITYPYERCDNNVGFIEDNAIKIMKDKINIFNRNNEKVIIFKSPVRHNLVENAIVKLNFGGRRSECFSIYELGDINSENNDVYFSIKYRDIVNKIPDIFNQYDNINYDYVLFNKVENGVNCEYYFRKHKVIPNFKFAAEDINSVSQDRVSSYIDDLLDDKRNYLNTKINNLSFAENVYSDSLVELLFTDDIQVNRLTNTLGAPLDEIYLTIIRCNEKDNKGTKYISPFGKVTAGLDLSHDENDYNVHKIHNIKIEEEDNKFLGIKTSPQTFSGEITSTDKTFLGDLVEYSPSEFKETIIEGIYYRFNTTQRENIFSDGNLYYDDIDGVDLSSSESTVNIYNNIDGEFYPSNLNPEGYYYKPHYPIKINNLSTVVYNDYDKIIVYKIDEENKPTVNINKDGSKTVRFTVTDMSYMQYGDAVYLENKNNHKIDGYVSGINIEQNILYVDFNKSMGDIAFEEYKLFKVNFDIPSYAYKYKDLSGRYVWRNILNKSDVTNDNEVNDIIFTNNALYIEKRFNFFLRRQDPNGEYGLRYAKSNSKGHKLYNFVIDGKKKDTSKFEFISNIKWRIC